MRHHQRRYDIGTPLFDSTRASVVCTSKVRFTSRKQAKAFARHRGLDQEPYHCEGCHQHHLRTKRRGRGRTRFVSFAQKPDLLKTG